MAETHAAGEKTSFIAFWRAHPIAATFATIGLLAVLAGTTIVLHKIGLIDFDLIQQFHDSDEAPIRVRNGSLDLYLVSTTQEWEQVGGSDNWKLSAGKRFKDDFEVTVAVKAGATCGGSLTATGSDVVFTYNNDKKIRIQSQSKHTFVKPDGVTLTRDTNSAQKLMYSENGFIKTIAVGNGANPTTMCTFTAANQLDHVIILNVP